MTRSTRKFDKREELVGRLLNEDVSEADWKQLNELLAGDIEAQKWYLQSIDLDVAIRKQAQSLDDEDFAVQEVQAALDAQPASPSWELPHDEWDNLPVPASEISRQSTASWLICHCRQMFSGRRKRVGWTVTAAVVLVGVTLATIEWATPGTDSAPSVATNSPTGTGT